MDFEPPIEWTLMTMGMDNADVRPAPKQSFDGSFFPERLWANPSGLRRSPVMSPLYAERFKGVRRAGRGSSHSFWEFTFAMDGEMDLLAGGSSLHLSRGSAVLVPPNLSHEERAAESVDSIWIGFQRGGDFSNCAMPLMANSSELPQAAEAFWRFSQLKKGLCGNELDGMLLSLYGLFARLLETGSAGETELLADKAIRLLNERFTESLSLSEAASELGVSEGHFFRAFKESFKITPLEHLTGLRLKHACQLLVNTQMNLAAIAKACGYQDQFYFSRVFKKWRGESPSSYRVKALGSAPL